MNYGILLLATAFCLLPILWGLSTSLKTLGDINAYPPRWIPSSLHLGNYAEVFQTPKFVRYLLNSVVVLVATLAVSLGAAAHAAYGASRFTFYGKTPLMLLMWSTVMIPGVAVIVPIYLLSVKLSLYDTYTVLVLLALFSLSEALDVIERVEPQQAYLTHIAHDMDHETINRQLPSNVALAYDGLKFAF